MNENDELTEDLFDTPVLDEAEEPISEEMPLDGDQGGNHDGPPPALTDFTEDAVPLGLYAERAYLEYAVSVVKGRALPDVCDGQKPVQRRILYAMHEMGLSPAAKPVKSARVVGEVLGKYHPHSDVSAYDAMVRLAQDFSLRYPLIDGQGNFGSRDGDGAAAMRYTEARLTKLAELLLSEIDRGTVDFIPNYDGAFEEPKLLPARLPMVLLNGASGIAVGMATEIPSHNLREVADAAVALIKKPDLATADLLQYVQGPDFPGGGQIISAAKDIQAAYENGRGSLTVRARWKVEDLARGQWQVVVTELPPNTSSQKVLEEIEDLTNPKVKKGKKALTQDQMQTKQLLLSQLDTVRDESGKDQAVRLVFEPKSSRQNPDEFMNLLLTHTSLEGNCSINMVMIGIDGRPQQKSLKQVLSEWVDFRFQTVTRRTQHRLGEVDSRIHILEGRLIVYLNIDEVIRIIRNADDPKADLVAAFGLSDRQAEDILEIRLRQLARLEGIKIEQELEKLRGEKAELEHLLADSGAMQKLIISEIKADAKAFGDDRRTLIETTGRATLVQQVVDEPLTIILSKKGWIRSRTGHGHDPQNFGFKEGDGLFAALECRSVEQVILFGSNGRVFSLLAGQIPGGRGDGVPIATLIDLPPGVKVVQTIAGKGEQRYLLAASNGYGFTTKLESLISRVKAGKQYITLDAGDTLLPPFPFDDDTPPFIAALSKTGRLLLFTRDEMKELAGGGKGVQIMSLDDQDCLLDLAFTTGHALSIIGKTPRGKDTTEKFDALELAQCQSKRGRKGKVLSLSFTADGFAGEG
ncbi:topoisomerase-4 subunit A [Chitinivorax tropicus]|uniref:DNA topoisomerase 4 subunit A n=2 Tax=Chitinivorax tropicus TaxID=714531 RepID=A0A840MHS8_9PROT|nr:DNA topoisomerase IV subunit A [Chitinivorax tropicus]MBB5017950.1 topoisomerase-4 subunit A [Chitinivorax tropicus]